MLPKISVSVHISHFGQFYQARLSTKHPMEVHAGQTLNTVPYYVSPMNASVFGTYSKMGNDTRTHSGLFSCILYL